MPLPGAIISGYASQSVTYSGPIPPPHYMREYDTIIPGAAERILAMAENQTAHRIRLESLAVESGLRRSYWGLASGFFISMTVIGIGGYAMLHGQSVVGFGTVVLALGTLAGVFIYGRSAASKERAEKSKAMKRR